MAASSAATRSKATKKSVSSKGARSGGQSASRRRGRPAAGSAPVGDREDFLDAALERFSDVGFEGASMRELARGLGVSHRLLHSRFGTKLDLWQAAVDHGIGRLAERVESRTRAAVATDDPVERLRTYFVEFLLALDEAPAILKLMNYEGARDSERLDYIADRFFARGDTPQAAIAAEGLGRGRLRDVSPATLFLVMAHGGGAVFCLRPLARHLGMRARRSAATRRAQAEEVADLLLAGLVVRDD